MVGRDAPSQSPIRARSLGLIDHDLDQACAIRCNQADPAAFIRVALDKQ